LAAGALVATAHPAAATGECGQVQQLAAQGASPAEIASAFNVPLSAVQGCLQPAQGGGVITRRSAAGAAPIGAAGPAPLGAAGPAPLGAAGPPPLGAPGPAPLGAAGPSTFRGGGSATADSSSNTTTKR
jgi:hypothetical protein